jgi:hypothetical protein
VRVKENQVVALNDCLFRVIALRDTLEQPLSLSSVRRRPNVYRTRYLATCRHNSGKIVSVYTGNPYMDIRPVSFVRRMVAWVTGELPR